MHNGRNIVRIFFQCSLKKCRCLLTFSMTQKICVERGNEIFYEICLAQKNFSLLGIEKRQKKKKEKKEAFIKPKPNLFPTTGPLMNFKGICSPVRKVYSKDGAEQGHGDILF